VFEVVSAGKNTLFDGAVVEACLALFREKDYSFPQSLTRHGGSSS